MPEPTRYPCSVCGDVTTHGPLCPTHEQEQRRRPRHRRAAHRAVYSTRRWRRLARHTVRAWVAEHGWICPGHGRPAHETFDLTADHVVPLEHGGAPLDPGNLAVLCRECNGRKADREAVSGQASGSGARLVVPYAAGSGGV